MAPLERTRVQEPGGPSVVSLRKCKLVVVKGAHRGKEVEIASDVIRVGTAESNDLVLAADTVSRLHCEIVRDAKGYLVRDLGSTNGTHLDGARINEAYLRNGSIVAVGEIEIKFQPFEERIEILPLEQNELGKMVGRSIRMREIFGLVERIGPTDATVLLEGETGTGKDLVARTLHDLSRRKEGPFVVVDCGAVASTLIESELFGHEKGSFTGASALRKGAFESANGGTVFLDELGELSLELQPKLLRVLEQREFRRVGGNKTLKVDVRVIAATKKNLLSEVEKGKFREDLYFRLSVVPIEIPPLRTRKEDIPLLVDLFLSALGGDKKRLDESTMAELQAHDWPGNIRELRNVLERAVVLGTDPDRLVAPLGGRMLRKATDEAAQVQFQPGSTFREQKEKWSDAFEKRYLRWLLDRADGNVSKAAREADMDRKYLHKLLKKHDIE